MVLSSHPGVGGILVGLLLVCKVAFGATPTPSIEEMQSRVAAIEASTSLPDKERSLSVELYRSAIADLEAIARDEANAREFSDALTTAPRKTANWQRRADSIEKPHHETPRDLDALSRSLVEDQAQLSQAQAKLSAVKAAIIDETELDLSQKLADVQTALTQPEPTLDRGIVSKEGLEAIEVAAVSRRAALRIKAEMLEQRLLSRDVRLAQMAAERQFFMLIVDTLTERVEYHQSISDQLRQREAGQAARRTEALATRLEEHPLWVRNIAEENANLAAQIAAVTAQIEALGGARKTIATNQNQIARYHDNLMQQLAITGAEQSAELGRAMVRQRNRLDEANMSMDSRDLERDITSARLRQLKLEDQRLALSTVRTLRPAPAADEHAPTDVNTNALAARLYDERLELLDDGVATYRRHISELTGIRSQERALDTQTTEYKNLLDRRLFWIPSAESFDAESWASVWDELRWILAETTQLSLVTEAQQRLQAYPVLAICALLILCSLVLARRPVWRVFNQMRTRLDNAETDAIGYTWLGVGTSVIFAAPLPLILGTLGLFLQDTQGFSSAVGSGLIDSALLLSLFLVLIQFFRNQGIAQVHFKWSPHILTTLQRNLPPITFVLVPATVLLAITEASSEAVGVGGLNRLCFALWCLLISLYAARLASALRIKSDAQDQQPTKIRRLALFIAIAVPLALVCLSMSGYHFTAQLLASRIAITLCIVVAGVLFFLISARSVSVIERRLAFAAFKDNRAYQRQQSNHRQAADSAGEGLPETLNLLEMPVDTLGGQTRSLVKLSITAVTGLIMWQFWSDLLPALSVVDDLTLWFSGKHQDPVTLGDLLLAFSITAVSTVAYRNLPGALEVSLLTRLNLETGANFAITTMSKYLVAIIGACWVLGILGMQWSEIQWLVAALGVGLGFGLQEIVANFVSGVLILFERPIRVGDTVTVGTQTGTVSRIRMRATTITDWDRKEQIIPNKTFMNEQLTNWTLSDPITRLVVEVTVAQDSNAAAVHQVLLQVAQTNDRVIADPSPAVFFVGFGEHGLNFEMRVFIKNMLDRMPLTHELHLAIEKAFKQVGIEIPIPHRDIRIITDSTQTEMVKTQMVSKVGSKLGPKMANATNNYEVSAPQLNGG